MKTRDTAEPTMSREEMADDYPRLKREYTLLHEEYRRLQSEKDKQLRINNVMQAEPEKICPKCGSNKVIMFDSDLDICKKCNHTF